MKRWNISLLLLLLWLVSCETVTTGGGSATDVGNPTVMGRLVEDAATGVLTGVDGEPIVGAVVTIADTAYNPLIDTNRIPLLRDTTDERGRFSLKPPEVMQAYTVFASFPDSLGFAFSAAGIATDSLDFIAPVGPTGSILFLYPASAKSDTAGLHVWLKGSEFLGSFPENYAGIYHWGKGDSSYVSMRIKEIPYGFAPEVRWHNERYNRGDWLVRGYGIYADELQVIAAPCSSLTICVRAIYRVPLKR